MAEGGSSDASIWVTGCGEMVVVGCMGLTLMGFWCLLAGGNGSLQIGDGGQKDSGGVKCRLEIIRIMCRIQLLTPS